MDKTLKLSGITIGAITINGIVGTVGLSYLGTPDTITAVFGGIILMGLGIFNLVLFSTLLGEKNE